MKEACFLLVILCSLVSLSYAQTTYSYAFLNNGTCQPVQVGQCIPCQYAAGYTIYYYQLEHNEYYTEANIFRDSVCSNFYSYSQYQDGHCSGATSFGNCEFYIQVESASVMTLTLTSTQPIEVTLLPFDEQRTYTQISTNKAVAEGEDLRGVQIKSDGSKFFVESQLSDTQYSTNIGIFSFGETHTHAPFTFTVTQSNIEVPQNLPNDLTVVQLSSFYTASVSNTNVFPTYSRYGGELNVLVDSSYDLEGLTVSNNYYAVTNMTLYPPFGGSEYGQLVFQFERSSSPFYTVDCYNEEDSLEQQIFYCEIGSISGYFGSFGSFYSFSLDAFIEKKLATPDEMAFALF